jgi:hypothetical protein
MKRKNNVRERVGPDVRRARSGRRKRRLALCKVCPSGKSVNSVQPLAKKYSAFAVGQISATSSPRPCPARGAVARRHERGAGMRWTRQRRRANVRRAVFRERATARRTNGAKAYGKTVWSRHPLLVPSCRWRHRSDRIGIAIKPAATVTRRIRRRGEHDISRKPLRRECRSASAEPVCSCALSLHNFAHETAGAARTRHSLLPLFRGDRVYSNLGQIAPREGGRASAV